jgi:fused signal recognition particle receptor
MGFFSSLRKILPGASPQADRPSQTFAPVSFPVTAGDEDLTLALRAAEPRLSAWLGVVLAGVDGPGPLLRQRLSFLLTALETPVAERDAFLAAFQAWLQGMEYTRLEDFRSELQYRLALALDLEDEEDERSRLILKISAGLAKTRERIARGLDALFSADRALDAAFWEELEEVLITADVGVETARALTGRLRARAAREGIHDPGALREALRQELCAVFKPARRITALNPPEIILLVGVNGVGKTTTIAKLCHRAVLQGKKVLLAAGDTFRAAATEQLEIWARRAGAGFYAKGDGADPAAVAFESVDKALAEGYDTLFVDTAGRLHTKANLMEELLKIRRVLGKRHPGAPHRTILVLDATSGQNALAQVRLFRETAQVDEIILTKLDGTAKGGIAVAIASRFTLPISFVGLGEKLEDLRPFDSKAFVDALLGGQ